MLPGNESSWVLFHDLVGGLGAGISRMLPPLEIGPSNGSSSTPRTTRVPPSWWDRRPCDCGKCSLGLSEVPHLWGFLTCCAHHVIWILEGNHLSDSQGLLLHRPHKPRPANPATLVSSTRGVCAPCPGTLKAETRAVTGLTSSFCLSGHCSLLSDVLCFQISHFIYFSWFGFVCLCVFFKKKNCFKSVPLLHFG